MLVRMRRLRTEEMAKLTKITKLMKLKVGNRGVPHDPVQPIWDTIIYSRKTKYPHSFIPENLNPSICLFQG